MDDITFGHNGPSDGPISGKSLLSTNALFIYCKTMVVDYSGSEIQQKQTAYRTWPSNKQTFIDIRLRPGIATLLTAAASWCNCHVSVSRPLRPNITYRNDARRTEPWPHGIPAVPDICSRTHRPTHTQTNWSQYSAPLLARVMMTTVRCAREYDWKLYSYHQRHVRSARHDRLPQCDRVQHVHKRLSTDNTYLHVAYNSRWLVSPTETSSVLDVDRRSDKALSTTQIWWRLPLGD